MTSNGYGEASSPEEADLILLNTCCVTGECRKPHLWPFGQLKERSRKQRPGLIIGVCGCMAQESERGREDSEASYPQVDLVFGTHNLQQLPELLQQLKRKSLKMRSMRVWEIAMARFMEGLPVKAHRPF